MRILRKWWISLPLAAFVPVGVAILEVYKGNILAPITIGFLCLALISQGLLAANPERQPLILLRHELKQEARNQRYHVLRQIGNSTYVFVEDSDDKHVITLWFFDGEILDLMRNKLSEQVLVPTRGVRIALNQAAVFHRDGIATLHYDPSSGTYAISPPEPRDHPWIQHIVSANPIEQKRLITRFWQLLKLAEARGRRHRFEK